VLNLIIDKNFTDPELLQLLLLRGASGSLLTGINIKEKSDKFFIDALRSNKIEKLSELIGKQKIFIHVPLKDSDYILNNFANYDYIKSMDISAELYNKFKNRSFPILSSINISTGQIESINDNDNIIKNIEKLSINNVRISSISSLSNLSFLSLNNQTGDLKLDKLNNLKEIIIHSDSGSDKLSLDISGESEITKIIIDNFKSNYPQINGDFKLDELEIVQTDAVKLTDISNKINVEFLRFLMITENNHINIFDLKKITNIKSFFTQAWPNKNDENSDTMIITNSTSLEELNINSQRGVKKIKIDNLIALNFLSINIMTEDRKIDLEEVEITGDCSNLKEFMMHESWKKKIKLIGFDRCKNLTN
jgi:hypothetical protein